MGQRENKNPNNCPKCGHRSTAIRDLTVVKLLVEIEDLMRARERHMSDTSFPKPPPGDPVGILVGT